MSQPRRRLPPAVLEAARFFGVSLVGATLDIAIAYGVATRLSAPLWIAAICGFAVAATFNYALHEVWTFREGARQLSGLRAMRYLVVALVTLVARVAVVVALERATEGRRALAVLLCGAGASFFVNYRLSRSFVFAKSSPRADWSR